MQYKNVEELKDNWANRVNGPNAFNDYRQFVQNAKIFYAFLRSVGVNYQFEIPNFKQYAYRLFDFKFSQLMRVTEYIYEDMLAILSRAKVFEKRKEWIKFEPKLKQCYDVEKPGRGGKTSYEAELGVIIRF